MEVNQLNRNNPAITLSRVLGMIFIILCHVVSYYAFIPFSKYLDQFFNCGVQLFLFVSGYLYGGKTVGKFTGWYFKRIKTVALPSALISAAVIAALLIASETVKVSSVIAYALDLEGLLFLSYDTFSKIFEEIEGLGPLWFTTVIMICYLLVPLLQFVAKKIKRRYILFIVLFSLIGFAVSVLLEKYVFLFFFVLFSIGYFSGRIKVLDKIKNKGFIIYTVFFVLSTAGRMLARKYFDESDFYFYYTTFSHMVVGTWFVVLFSYLSNKLPNKIDRFANTKAIKALDGYSYYLFLTHAIFCIGTFNFYNTFSLPVATLLFLVCTVVSAVILKSVTDLITGKLKSKKQ